MMRSGNKSPIGFNQPSEVMVEFTRNLPSDDLPIGQFLQRTSDPRLGRSGWLGNIPKPYVIKAQELSWSGRMV